MYVYLDVTIVHCTTVLHLKLLRNQIRIVRYASLGGPPQLPFIERTSPTMGAIL